MASQVLVMNWYLPRNAPPPPIDVGLPPLSHDAMRSSTAFDGPPGTAGHLPPAGVPAEETATGPIASLRLLLITARSLKEIAAGGDVKGDITTLEDFSVVAALQSEEYRSPAELALKKFAPESGHIRNQRGDYSHTFNRKDLQQELHQLFAAQQSFGNPHVSDGLSSLHNAAV